MTERPSHPDPRLLAVSRGDSPADLLLRNARVVNVFSGTIDNADIAICGSRIAAVARRGELTDAATVADLHDQYVAPGLIDAHMHVESTMMMPSRFVRVAAPHGTTGVVLDPHEIANVLGVPGIRLLMDDAAGLPMNFMFAVSSCVPSSPLETSGARLEAADLAPLFDDPRVVALAEMMNFPGVVSGDAGVLDKVRLGLSRRIVDGHAPGLTGPALQAYIAAGISSDHECTTRAEAEEKLRLGMRIYIREGSAAKNLEALLPAVTDSNKHRFSFCTDDRHPADLVNEGHIDHAVRKAVALGMNPVTAISLGSFFTAQHFGRRDLGAIAPGFLADFFTFTDLRDIRPRDVFFHGEPIVLEGRYTRPESDSEVGADRLAAARDTVHLPDALDEESFRIPARAGFAGPIRVIGMNAGQLVTSDLRMSPRVHSGFYVSDPARDIAKIAVIERHRPRPKGPDAIGRAFVHGFGLKRGALASTVGHDAHNLAVLGVSDRDMVAAARAVAQVGGGQAVALDGRVLAVLPLPIAGLISDQPVNVLLRQQAALFTAAHALGCPLSDPFMPLSFICLPVIPSLKLTDRGLVDVDRFQVVPLEAESA